MNLTTEQRAKAIDLCDRIEAQATDLAERFQILKDLARAWEKSFPQKNSAAQAWGEKITLSGKEAEQWSAAFKEYKGGNP